MITNDKLVTVTVMVHEDLRQWIRDEAAKHKTTNSSYIKNILEELRNRGMVRND